MKTKNWKHCNKIILKCVNSAVRLIFNENFVKKEICGFGEQCTGPRFGCKRQTHLLSKHTLKRVKIFEIFCLGTFCSLGFWRMKRKRERLWYIRPTLYVKWESIAPGACKNYSFGYIQMVSQSDGLRILR